MSEKGRYGTLKLSPRLTAKKLDNSVLIKKRSGNLVEKIYLDEEQWEAIGELFGRSVGTDSDRSGGGR